MTISTKTS